MFEFLLERLKAASTQQEVEEVIDNLIINLVNYHYSKEVQDTVNAIRDEWQRIRNEGVKPE